MTIDPAKRRDLTVFLLGPAAITLIIAVVYKVAPWPVPLQAQAELLGITPVVIVLTLAVLGLLCSRAAGIPDIPPKGDRNTWKSILLATVPLGLLGGALLLAADALFGFTSVAIQAIGVTWAHVPLPQSLLTSLLEPAGFLAAGGVNLQLATLLLIVFAINVLEAAHYKRYGWAAPLLFRMALYLVWHCFGPYLLPADSILYPGIP
ncbi:MAG: hypothetical protein A3H44_14065 [Gammaproteobacteria bacterium RIFCSPLOWO2_02_FULL_57_10]|nr:MAG: hypothetical protein A3H44_14065 [Gammaproteobacteria bacterium RIFCSPLOWO2_02_FULL_57_10]